MLSADKRRSALLSEEFELIQQFDVQEQLQLQLQSHQQQQKPANTLPVQTVFKGAQVVAAVGNSTGATIWDETQWAQKLDRFVSLGSELEASGADACESKVCFQLYDIP